MEKADVKSHEAQSDTSSVINMKEYAASEYPSSEPPPAYMKPRHSALRIARLAAFTIITSSVILGVFILAASWIQANTARNLDLTLNQELMDDLHPSYEHLIANEVLPEQQDNRVNLETADSKKEENTVNNAQQDDQENKAQVNVLGQEEKPSLELDEIANMLVQKGMRGNVNCIVEKRRNEELVDHAPRSLNLPFGLNITTPPRLQHLTGEQVVIICKDDNEDKSEEKEAEQQMLIPVPQQMLHQIQQVPQIIPLSQILQHLPQQQQPIFIPQQQQEQQQVLYNQQPIYQHQQQPIYQHQQQQPIYQHQQQQPIYHHQQQPQIQIYQQPQRQMFIPQQQQFPFPQQPQQEEQQMPVPLRQVPISQLINSRMPINPMAIQDVPMSQMQMTHMPMREAVREQRMPEQPVPVHHLVPPRPQQMHVENFGQDETRIPFDIIERLNREREMAQTARPRPLPLEMREPRLMRGPVMPMNGNGLPDFPIREQPRPAITPRFPPGRPFRFPDSEPEGMSITRIIPIRLEKDSDEESDNGVEEKRPLPIALNAILDMVFKGMRPFANRQPFPVPIDIKIERIQNKPIMENSSESEESREEGQDSRESQETQDGQEDNEQASMMEDKPEESNETKIQQIEIVEKEGENTQAIPIPADAQDAQVFKLEDKPEEEWAGRAFLPNGQGRGGVFPIPQGMREAQIFTVSDARAGTPVSASYEVAPKEDEEESPAEARVINFGQPEGEVNLFPVPMNAERSVRLYPVDEPVDKPQQPEPVPQETQKMEQGEQAEESRPHFVQPRSV